MRVTAVAVLTALAIAACGSGGGGGGTTGGSGDGPTTLAVQETAGVPSAFVAFGMAKGFFAKQRLKIDSGPRRAGRRRRPRS